MEIEDIVRMLEAVPLLAVTIGFISIFTYIFANAELTDIRKNWNERRCEPVVISMAHLVPTDEGVDTNKFSSDNFHFCLSKIMLSSVSTFLSPMLSLFSKQVDTVEPILQSINSLRKNSASLMDPLQKLTGGLWQKFNFVFYQMARIFGKMFSAMDRVLGISVASIFAGMAMYKGIQNMMEYVIQVCITILTILVILVIFAWFYLFPLVPLILTLIGVLSATVHAGRVGGMGGAFCVSPDTLVVISGGGKKRVDEIVSGDILEDGSVVEGILKTTGKYSTCVNLNGVILSEGHLVWNEKWISAGDHADAIPVPETENPPFLYCLNTSKRVWKVVGQSVEFPDSSLLLRDWEELPTHILIDEKWERLINSILNPSFFQSDLLFSRPGRGMIGSDTLIQTMKDVKKMRNLQIGDFVKDVNNTFTQVLGIYSDTSEIQPKTGINSSAWFWSERERVWTHIDCKQNLLQREGNHLITESGTFYVEGFLVRDFTEVGSSQINQTYAFTESSVNFPSMV